MIKPMLIVFAIAFFTAQAGAAALKSAKDAFAHQQTRAERVITAAGG